MGSEFLSEENEPVSHFTAYSGTTWDNYLIEAHIEGDGSVVYDKRKNPLHEQKDTLFLETPIGALEYAALRALELRSMPVVMEGSIPTQYRRTKALPSGIVFPVRTLWMPRERMNRVERAEYLLRATEFGQTREVFASMIPVDPASILRKRS